jgi:hypothetical protein
MFDYSERIEKFRKEKVRLSTTFLQKLLAHRQANRDRLIARLPDYIPGLTINDSLQTSGIDSGSPCNPNTL